MPALPVRPILCSYLSMLSGMSMLMTYLTLGRSRPLDATSVATSTVHFFSVNRVSARSLSDCFLSPWMQIALTFSLLRKFTS